MRYPTTSEGVTRKLEVVARGYLATDIRLGEHPPASVPCFCTFPLQRTGGAGFYARLCVHPAAYAVALALGARDGGGHYRYLEEVDIHALRQLAQVLAREGRTLTGLALIAAAGEDALRAVTDLLVPGARR